MSTSHAPHDAGNDLRRLIPLAIWSTLALIAVVLISRSAAGAFTRSVATIIPCLIGAAALALSLAAWWWDDRLRGGATPHSVAGVSDPGRRAPGPVAGVSDPDSIASTASPGVTDSGYSNRAQIGTSSHDRSVRGIIALLPPLAIGITTSGGASAAVTVLLGLGLISTVAVLVVTWELDPRLALRRLQQFADDLPLPFWGERAGVRGAANTESLSHSNPAVTPQDIAPLGSSEAAPTLEAAPDSVFSDPGVSQHITRRTTPDGLDCLEVLLRIPFAAGEREAVVHLPLHPPLPGAPEVECEPLDDDDLTFKVTTAQPYGVRIEVRRGGGYDEPCTFAVGVALHARKAA